jgi:hypothetical protein
MKITVTDEFRSICQEITKENRSIEKWAAVESDDMFQTESYCGGYDSDEGAFCFSCYDSHGNEYYFQLSLEEIEKVLNYELTDFDARFAR